MKKHLAIVLISFAVIACGEKKEERYSYESQNTAAQNTVEIKDAWIRPAAENANSGMFMEIVNRTAQTDTIIGVESGLAKVVQVHETFKDEKGMMGMREVENLEIPAGGTLQLKPGSYHVMLIGLNQDLKIGDKGTAVLKFKHAGDVSVSAEVRDMPKGM